jgi:hypothetical protein
VIDQDLDFELDAKNEFVCKKPKSAKGRVLEALRKINCKACYGWITDGYTIESYLPDEFRNKYFQYKDGRLVLGSRSKMEVAAMYANKFCSIEGCSNDSRKLMQHVGKIYEAIFTWES